MQSLYLAFMLTSGIIPVNLTASIIQHESAGDERALSHAGAKGLMQMTPIALKDVVQRSHLLPRVCKRVTLKDDMFNGTENVRAGQCFYKLMLIEFKGDHNLAIRAYNAGAGKVRKWMAGKERLAKETIDYHKRVTTTWKKLREDL